MLRRLRIHSLLDDHPNLRYIEVELTDVALPITEGDIVKMDTVSRLHIFRGPVFVDVETVSGASHNEVFKNDIALSEASIISFMILVKKKKKKKGKDIPLSQSRRWT